MTERKAKTYFFKVKADSRKNDKNNRSITRRALVSSVLSLVISCVFLIGSTLAWFTDSSDTATDKIIAGNLAIDLLMNGGSGYASISNKSGAIFENEELSPDDTAIAYLAVKNQGTMTTEYEIRLTATAENGTQLLDSLEYAIIDGAEFGALDGSTWDEIASPYKLEAGTFIVKKDASLKGNGTMDCFALAIHMDKGITESPEGTVTIDVTVLAKQTSAD